MEYFEQEEQVLKEKGSSPGGLSAETAAKRLLADGPNKLAEGGHKTMLRRVLEQISDPMIIVLIAAGIVSGAFGEIADMVIILIVVALNAVLGIYQEGKAEKAIEALQQMAAPHSRLRRDGAVCVVPSEEIVVGDVVLLEAGDAVPADLRLIETASLKIEEAALTGESVPVTKDPRALEKTGEEIPLGDRVNMAYMGTNAAYGRGEGVVVRTGMDTEMGKIANILSGTPQEKTPLQQKLAGLSKVLSVAVLGICAFVFLFSVLRTGSFRGENVFEALLTAVSLAVAAIPEGLVVVVTVVLSMGVTKMSARNAIIRRLTTVETLGCTRVICSDKTGTLTQNKMTAVDAYGDPELLGEAMFLCNDVEADPGGKLVGDPTQLAQKEYGISVGADKRYPRVGEIPFDAERKMMSTFHDREGQIRQYTTGAPDEILRNADRIFLAGKVVPLTDALRKSVLEENKRMADRALRVLAGAYRDYDRRPRVLESQETERSMIFLGLIGMIDPIRPEVKDAVAACKTAGIRVVMITGDHKDTAVAIARQLGILADAGQAMTGAELSALSDDAFERRIGEISVYARVQPEHKVRIVRMWRKKGMITAMTGDGVNDAPALKSADIGVGMGITGTDVTKNVSDMVLADDNFASIVFAVEEGRRIYENIRKAIQFLLSSNLSEVVSIFLATLLGWKLFAPIQILWINLITDTFPAMALGMERAESDAMKKPPRDTKESIFAGHLGLEVIWQGSLIGLLTLLSFFLGYGQDQTTGMTMAFLTLSMCEIFHAVNMRSRKQSIFRIGHQNPQLLWAMVLSFVLTAGVIYLPGLNTVFSLTALSLGNFAAALGIALIIIPVVELAKLFKRRGKN